MYKFCDAVVRAINPLSTQPAQCPRFVRLYSATRAALIVQHMLRALYVFKCYIRRKHGPCQPVAEQSWLTTGADEVFDWNNSK